ncbi:MAG: hypothetical protein TREMPRED_005154 [Tremellales sp. Tagirdzhanova-0007]|nr:MAG: hypothetical protein TREMPRED_005154 [Tremellales sp. Tagirdzhanova-0007]
MASTSPFISPSDSLDEPSLARDPSADRAPPRDTPRSLRPHLFGGNDTPRDERAVGRASEVMELSDYRGLRAKTTTRGMSTGVLGAVVLISGSGISYFSSQALLASELAKIRSKAMARVQPQAEGGGALFTDTAHHGALEPLAQPPTSESTRPTASNVPLPASGRTRFAKGKGLEGEVEEESEMRDTYFRPGVPRRDV